MGAQKSVSLPQHLWSALDDMSRDGAATADALMEMAVEQFVALQGYDVPSVNVPAPHGLQDDGDEEPFELARTRARTALEPKSELPPPALSTEEPPARPVPNITGIAPTHVPRREKGHKPLEAAPAVTDQQPAMAEAPAPPPSAPPPPVPSPAVPPRASPGSRARASAPAKPAPPPEWVTRAALSDADEERTAARERMAAIDREVERLTLERPTATPLGQPIEDD
jgi:hypothetical protein